MAKTKESATSKYDPDLQLGEKDARQAFTRLGIVGGVALIASLGIGFSSQDGGAQFLHSYLVAFMWVLSIGLGALWWVTLQHLVNAKWSIALRRVGELIAANMPLLAILALPIVIPTLLGNSSLYLWADTGKMHANHVLSHKVPYLNGTFFAVRLVIYFGLWVVLSRFFFKRSMAQDDGGSDSLVQKMRSVAAPGMIGIALTLTFAAIDLMMSLDPMWFSTIFGVYYFAGCVLAIHSTFALVLMWLQKKGRMVRVITTAHYHDVGKMMFAFIVFWAYIGFSQFMLIWYANVPEETAWYRERVLGDWAPIAWTLLICHFVLPFLGLLSRHVKRNRKGLAFWAVWILVIHYVDLYWLIMPHLSPHHPSPNVLDLTCLVGLGSTFFAAIAYRARKIILIPSRDPRLAQSLAFENI